MKLLVVTYNALMVSTPNGRTMISLLDGYKPDEIINFCVSGIPDKKYSGGGYKVTNKNALAAFFCRKEQGGPVESQSAEETNRSFSRDSYHKKKSPWKYYLREYFWRKGAWRQDGLKNWLKSQKFDCIVYMYGDGAAVQDFSVFASGFLNIPLIVYSCEEYYFKDYNYINQKENSIWFKKYITLSKRATEQLFARADVLICNTDRLGALYAETFGISEVKTIMMASEMEFKENVLVPAVEDMKITYCGSLGVDRDQALIDISEALNKIDSRLKLDVYGRADENTERLLSGCQYIRFHGFIPYAEVQKVIRDSTLLIETITFNRFQAKNRRFGFSTKNADSLACGTPYFLYERAEIVEMDFVKEHNCAFYADREENLVPALKEALFNGEARRDKVKNAKKTTDIYFNQKKNIEVVHGIIDKAVAKYRG